MSEKASMSKGEGPPSPSSGGGLEQSITGGGAAVSTSKTHKSSATGNFAQRFMSQFRKPRSEDFPGVVIPLEHAQRHHSVVSKAESEGEKMSAEEVERRGSTAAYDIHTIEGLRAEIESDLTAFGQDSTFDRKSKIINKAIQDMGMGPYQWKLFVLCGFGWFADNFWLQGVALTLTQVGYEFGIDQSRVRFTTMSLFIGLCIGASFWGIAADVMGRRLAFNTTLFLAAVFGLSAAGANSWIGYCALCACTGLGVGGNLPVDGALFLEFLPFASGNLLTLLSIWWPVGSMIASLFGWGLIPKYACAGYGDCPKESNMGWRYFLIVLGCVTFVQWSMRFIFFQMFESPKFLLSRGRQAEAVAVVHGLAYRNKTQTWLTEEILNEVGGYPETADDTKLSIGEIISRSLSKFSTQRIGPLFGNWKLGLTTGLLWFQWCTIGMGYPLFNAFLPQYIKQNGGSAASGDTVYRDYAISTVVGVPGSAIAYYTVNIKYVGRKGTMAIATALTGVFVCLFTTSTTESAQLGFNCMAQFSQNVMYGVLYAYTPEVFPSPNRGTGTGIASFFNRIGGLCAPIIGVYGSTASPKAPIFASAGLFFIAFLSMLFLPIETRGRQSL